MDNGATNLRSGPWLVNKQAGLPVPIVLIVAGLYAIWIFGCETVWPRWLTEVRGTVVASDDEYSPIAPARYGTRYTLRADDGREIHYTAGATDASLARSFPIGTRIDKEKWQLGYQVNGRWVPFPVVPYLLTLGAALIALLVGAYRWPAWRRSLRL